MVPEAKLERTEVRLVPASAGWFVLNARDARWYDKPRQGHSLPLTGDDEYEAETFFPMLGMAIRVVNPGEPTGTYHCADETAARYNASSPEDTRDGDVADARFPPSEPSRYREGWLPDTS